MVGSQESTELLKLVHWLGRLELDDEGRALSDPRWKPQMAETTRYAIPIQLDLFHWASRRIDREVSRRRVVESQPALWAKLTARFKMGVVVNPPRIVSPKNMMDETESYLSATLTLGRILRKMSQKSRQRRAYPPFCRPHRSGSLGVNFS